MQNGEEEKRRKGVKGRRKILKMEQEGYANEQRFFYCHFYEATYNLFEVY